MWYRASPARRLWQTEHTAGGIQEGKNERGSRGGNHLKGWMLDSSCHPPLPPAGGLPVCTGPDFKKKKKKDRGKSAGQTSTRGRSFRHSRRFPERHSWFQRFSRSNLRRSQCADVALREGTRGEGRRGSRMARGWGCWTGRGW